MGPEPTPLSDLPQVLGPTELSNSFLGNLVQVCVVTSDHRRTLEGFVRLGIGPWTVRTFDASNLTETTFRGRPAPFSMKVCLANSANMNWEVIEPVLGPSIYTEYLERHGDGVQHLAFDCRRIPYDEQVEALARRGYKLVQSGRYKGEVRFHYFETDGAAGTVFEVYHVAKGFVFPEPEAWYPAPPPGR